VIEAMRKHWLPMESRSHEEATLQHQMRELRFTHAQYLPALRAANERRSLYAEWTKLPWTDPVL